MGSKLFDQMLNIIIHLQTNSLLEQLKPTLSKTFQLVELAYEWQLVYNKINIKLNVQSRLYLHL